MMKTGFASDSSLSVNDKSAIYAILDYFMYRVGITAVAYNAACASQKPGFSSHGVTPMDIQQAIAYETLKGCGNACELAYKRLFQPDDAQAAPSADDEDVIANIAMRMDEFKQLLITGREDFLRGTLADRALARAMDDLIASDSSDDTDSNDDDSHNATSPVRTPSVADAQDKPAEMQFPQDVVLVLEQETAEEQREARLFCQAVLDAYSDMQQLNEEASPLQRMISQFFISNPNC